jgi:hypothetical protein
MAPKKSNKFDDLKRDDLLRMLLEQEDELERYRPKPAKFKLGQLLALPLGPGKHQWHPGQPAIFFVALALEHRNGEWHYGYSQRGPGLFNLYPEKKLRALTATEIDGTAMDGTPEATPSQVLPQAPQPGQTPNPWIIDNGY